MDVWSVLTNGNKICYLRAVGYVLGYVLGYVMITTIFHILFLSLEVWHLMSTNGNKICNLAYLAYKIEHVLAYVFLFLSGI